MAQAFDMTKAQSLAVVIGSVALLMLGLQPLLLGALLEAHRVTLEGVGLVAMGEIVALGLGVLIGDRWLSVQRLRPITAVAAIAAAGLNLATPGMAGDFALGLTRAGAGVAEGLMVWSTTAVIVRSARPERLAGLFFVTQTLAQALLGLLLARVVIPSAGWPGGFQALAMLSVLAAALAAAFVRPLQPLGWSPSTSGPPTDPASAPASAPTLAATLPSGAPSGGEATTTFSWTRSRIGTLLTVFLQLATLGALWAYAEPLGTRAGFSPTAVQTLIAAGLGMQVLGGSIGTWLVRRWSVRPTLLAGCVVLGLAALGVSRTAAGGMLAFAALCALFTFTWLFMLPFQMGLAFRVDASGQVAALVPAAQLFGSAFGPLMASLLVSGEEVAPVPFVAAGFALLAALTLPLTRSPTRAA